MVLNCEDGIALVRLCLNFVAFMVDLTTRLNLIIFP